MKIYPKLQKDLKEAGETTLYNCYTERGFELDHMSLLTISMKQCQAASIQDLVNY